MAGEDLSKYKKEIEQFEDEMFEGYAYAAIKTGFYQVSTTVNIIGYKEKLKITAPSVGFHVGYAFMPTLRAEASYTLIGKASDKITGYEINFGLGFEPVVFDIEQEISLFLTSLYYDFRTRTKLKPFIGAHLGYTVNSAKVTLNAPSHSETYSLQEETVLTYGGTAGASYYIKNGFRVEGSLQYIHTEYEEGQDMISGQIGLRLDF